MSSRNTFTLQSVKGGNTTGSLVMGVSMIVLVYAVNVLAVTVDAGDNDQRKKQEKEALQHAATRPTFLLTVFSVLYLWSAA